MDKIPVSNVVGVKSRTALVVYSYIKSIRIIRYYMMRNIIKRILINACLNKLIVVTFYALICTGIYQAQALNLF